jgi:hypothetical protein
MAEDDLENMLGLWEIDENLTLLINAEFGSSDELCSELQEMVSTDDIASFDEVCLTPEDFADCEIELSISYVDALTRLQLTKYKSQINSEEASPNL